MLTDNSAAEALLDFFNPVKFNADYANDTDRKDLSTGLQLNSIRVIRVICGFFLLLPRR
jgi:hypothetical protein